MPSLKIIKWFIIVFIFTLSTLTCVRGIEILQKNSVKVSNIFYGGFGQCFLSKIDVIAGVNPRIACVSICQRTENCWLVCIDGMTCNLYRATVASYYDPHHMDNTGPSIENAPGICYTIWLFPNDITDIISNVSATNPHMMHDITVYGALTEIKAVDGYSCDIANKHYYLSHNMESIVYFEARFPMLVKVSRILVKTRSASGSINYFKNMEARVGNASDVSNFLQNVKIGNTIVSFPDLNSNFIVFDSSTNPIIGKNIIIMQLNVDPNVDNVMVIEELKVIGHKIN